MRKSAETLADFVSDLTFTLRLECDMVICVM